ncbi:MAG: hypothetical protein Roseis2KO_43640 [Roseivirga sp.]
MALSTKYIKIDKKPALTSGLFAFNIRMKKTCLILSSLLILSLAACGTSQKTKNQQAIESRITAFMKNPENMLDLSNYEGLEYSEIDTLAGYEANSEKAFRLALLYKGLNTAGREVRREADVFFNKSFEVTSVETTKYLDPMSKEEYKNLGKN